MKKKFSTAWKSSSQPRKQRKYLANAPLHLKKKFMSVNLSKDLRKKHGKRNIPVVKGDKVRILRGKFKKKQGKVIKVRLKYKQVLVENIQVKKLDGSKVDVPLRPSNLQIIELKLDDKKRMKKLGAEKKVDKKAPLPAGIPKNTKLEGKKEKESKQTKPSEQTKK